MILSSLYCYSSILDFCVKSIADFRMMVKACSGHQFSLCRWFTYRTIIPPTLVAFQRFINGVLGDLLDFCTMGYLDDILVYLESLESHREHVRGTALTQNSRPVCEPQEVQIPHRDSGIPRLHPITDGPKHGPIKGIGHPHQEMLGES